MRTISDTLMAVLTAVALLAGACGETPDPPGEDSDTGPREIEEPDAGDTSETTSDDTDGRCEVPEALRELSDRTLASVGRLRDVGHLGVATAGQLLFRLLLANVDLYSESARRPLRDLLAYAEQQGVYDPDSQLERDDRGVWRRSLDRGLALEMQFLEPTGAPIEPNVFDLESYVRGPRVAHDMSFDAMRRSPEERNTWTVTWNDRGPLYHLLDETSSGRVANPFVVHASLRDLASLATATGIPREADLGPIAALLGLQLRSSLEFRSPDTADVRVAFRASTSARPVRRIIRRSALSYRLRDLRATDDIRTIRSESATLRAGPTGLDGTVDLAIDGAPERLHGAALTFEPGTSPRIIWNCR